MRRWMAGAVLVAAVAVAAAAGSPEGVFRPGLGDALFRSSASWPARDGEQAVQDTFPHATHQGLFPLCTGCHAGVPEGDESRFYPEPRSCQGCHDGTDQRRVDYTTPVVDAEPDNLVFSHPGHGQEVGELEEDQLDCQSCHVPEGAPRLAVAPLEAERCLSCHGHPAEDHYGDAPCATCHEPLAETRLPAARIAALPVPTDHEEDAFLSEVHGELVTEEQPRCATCHTQQICTSCHVDAASRSAIRAFPAAPPSLELPPFRAEYPVPASHLAEDFEEAHGELSESRTCATCHTRDDCASCHLSPLPDVAAGLPERTAVVAPGVGLMDDAPTSHATPFFMDQHDALAAAAPAECASCHTQPFCTECHEAPVRPAFHPEDYVARHPADAWSQNAECASCHETQTFCRACHVESGLESRGRLGRGYHDAEPVWLLRHGQAARQSLEACASCHTQRQCLQCHSELGSFQVNPHGPDFDARRAWERNPGICRACHIGDPIGGVP